MRRRACRAVVLAGALVAAGLGIQTWAGTLPVAFAQQEQPEEPASVPAAQEPEPAVESSAPSPTPDQREQALEGLRRSHRSARTAVLMTMVVPGWGQLYADSPFWSVVAFSVQMFYVGNIVMEGRRAERQSVRRDLEPADSTAKVDRGLLVTEHRERIRDFVWWSAGGLLIIGLDAYVSVELADFDDPYPPTPDLDRDWEQQVQPGSDAGAGVKLSLDFAF